MNDTPAVDVAHTPEPAAERQSATQQLPRQNDLGIGNYTVVSVNDLGGSGIVLICDGELMLACESCVVRYRDTPDDNTCVGIWTRGREVTVLDWTAPGGLAAATDHTTPVCDEDHADHALHDLGYQRIETWRPTRGHDCHLVRVVFIGRP